MKKNSVMIGIPDYGGSMRTECVKGLLSLSQNGITALQTIDCPSVRMGRNALASSFLANDSFTHLLFVDTDIAGFTFETIRYLIKSNSPVVGALYAKKITPPQVAAQLFSTKCTSYIPVEAKSIGLGLCLIRRDVFTTMSQHVKKKDGRWIPLPMNGQPLYGFFDPITENGDIQEEDYSFCRRCSDHGIKLMGVLCPEVFHVGSYRYRLVPDEILPSASSTA